MSIGLFSQDSGWYQIANHENHPQGAPMVGAGFGFSPSEILIDVPFDPYLDFLFHGGEFCLMMALVSMFLMSPILCLLLQRSLYT